MPKQRAEKVFVWLKWESCLQSIGEEMTRGLAEETEHGMMYVSRTYHAE